MHIIERERKTLLSSLSLSLSLLRLGQRKHVVAVGRLTRNKCNLVADDIALERVKITESTPNNKENLRVQKGNSDDSKTDSQAFSLFELPLSGSYILLSSLWCDDDNDEHTGESG